MNGQIPVTRLLEEVSAQADQAEVYELRSFQLPVSFTSGVLESVRSVETAGRALRVIKDGQLGFSTTTDLADDATVVQNALASAQFGDPVDLQFPAARPAPPVPCYDPVVEQLDERALIDLGKEVVAPVAAYNPEAQVNVSVRKARELLHLVNTAGLRLENERTFLQIWMLAERSRGDDIFAVRGSVSSRRRADIDGPAMARRIVERLRWAERIVPLASRSLPVVFHQNGVLPLLLPLLVGLSGRYVHMGISPLGERLGQRVLDERFSLVDDGRLDFAPRSVPYDDEGTPTAKKTLIERGVVSQFLYDAKTAARAETSSTGNGFKEGVLDGGGYHVQPDVCPSSWFIAPGDQGLEQILEGLDEALLVEQVLGLGQGNVVAGEFSNNVAVGFLVRRGEVVGRVKNTMIAGNIYELLGDHLVALSSRPEWIGGWLRSPAIVLEGVGIVGGG